MKHIHHIIPSHMGGSNDPSNLIELSIADHALAHKELFEKFGHIEDKIAWLCLSGKTEEGELLRIELAKSRFKEFVSSPKSENWKKNISNSVKARHARRTPEELATLKVTRSRVVKKQWEEGKRTFTPPLKTFEERSAHTKKNSEKMAEGRRASTAWLESVTSEEYRKAQSNRMKGRKITWGAKISEAKRRKKLDQ